MPLVIRAYEQQITPSGGALPRARSVASLDDPVGESLRHLADQVFKIGKGIYERQREADLHDRIGKATAELAELELTFERDPDFRTSPQRFEEQADGIRDRYLENVTDGGVATAFRKQFQQMALAKSINIKRDAWKKEKDYNVAALDENIDTYATSAANAKTPAEAALVENHARLAIASAQNGSYISAEEAGRRERTFLTKRDTAVVIRDMSIDASLTATKLGLDPTYAANVDPVQRERLTDQAFRRSEADRRQAEALEAKRRKERGDALYKEALSRQDKGTLTSQYIEEIRDLIEPAEYKSLLAGQRGEDVKDNPAAFAELQPLIYSNAVAAEARAYVLHSQRQISNATLASVISQARTISRQEGPRTEYERSKQFLTDVFKPSPAVTDPAVAARFALAIREFDDFANVGQPKPGELRAKADEIVKRLSLVDMTEIARRTSAGAQPSPELQLQAIAADAAKLIADRDANKIPQAEFNRKMEALNRARQAAERAARAHGGK